MSVVERRVPVRFSGILRNLQDESGKKEWRGGDRRSSHARGSAKGTTEEVKRSGRGQVWTGSHASEYVLLSEFEEELATSDLPTAESADVRRAETAEISVQVDEDDLAQWLYQQCIHVAATQQSGLRPDEMAVSVLSALCGNDSDEALQGDLFDVVGDFDAVVGLLSKRSSLRKHADEISRWLAQSQEGDRESRSVPRRHRGAGRASASGGSASFIQPSIQIIDRTRQRQDRAMQRLGFPPHAEAANDDGESWSRESAQLEALRQATEGVASSDRVALPKELVRTTHDGWEEYFMPAAQSTKAKAVPLVDIQSVLPPELRPAMDNVKRLNPVQSTVWKTALQTSENMLVCAPTGAGKTNIALMTILREASRFLNERGQVLREGWRVVYVAPMKALAAEVVAKFDERLSRLGLKVRELTGDMNLTRAEALDTQVVVVTPEKWDVVTRKAGGEGGGSVADAVSLLIIDEVHLLHDERGSVLESLVARTQRRAESDQRLIRLVGLSATLPNYRDIAKFLGVRDEGLFFFDASFRPVPLSQCFVGVQEKNPQLKNKRYLEIAFEKLTRSLREKNQCMVFVHSRKDTLATARELLQMGLFSGGGEGKEGVNTEDGGIMPTWALKEVAKFRSSELREICQEGIGIHHAGMLRADRKLVESLFLNGALQVLVCTATLAWGVNLPAHTVIIKGTQIYDAKRGGFVELSMLDVMQIFGRAGRPQFDTFGEGIILTSTDQLSTYLRLMTASLPIESRLQDGGKLPDHLNAEVVLGTVTSISEAVEWLGYTYLAVRIARNPLHYGVRWEEVLRDPGLVEVRRKMITDAAKVLDNARMIRFDERLGELAPTEVGRIASHYYVSYGTISQWNETLTGDAKDSDAILAVAKASEFEQVRPREDEMEELTTMLRTACPIAVKAGLDSYEGKVVTLLQAYVSRAPVRGFSLVSDQNYVAQSAARLMRALFELSLRRGWPSMSLTALELARSIDHRVWAFDHPLRQLSDDRRKYGYVPPEICTILRDAGMVGDLESLVELSYGELISLVRSSRAATQVRQGVRCIPALYVDAQCVPITRSVLRINVQLWPGFTWVDAVHGLGAEAWRLWVEDTEHDRIYHTERLTLSRRQCRELSEVSPLQLVLMVPVFDPPSPHYVVSIESERWNGAGTAVTLSLAGLILPQQRAPHTDLLDLRPLPKTALGDDPRVLSLYRFDHFNALQTQMFWTLFHTDENMLIGAPTGSGKTVTAELTALRVFQTQPKGLVVYVAPLKALVRERARDWRQRLCGKLGKKLVELTGEARASAAELQSADVIVTTPEKWDGVTRGWRQRSYVRRVALLILDEVHLLGSERGAVLEVLVSRARRIGDSVRLVALSTALANPSELADWLGVHPEKGMFNFRPSVRPVPCEVHIQGVAGEHYCPRMLAMNRPTFGAILRYSPTKPSLVFVSSRRQTRLTAEDLVRFAAAEGSPRRFVSHGGDDTRREIEDLLPVIRDESLRQTLEFGVGMHHAGLAESDRSIVERLFLEGKILVLVSTSTLAWGVNLPAHLVVVKGTEFFDVKQHRYVDMPLTDILQMIGRAGRPQFDDRAFAMVLVHEPKKAFYKKFLYEPFPVESSLPEQLADHINAEIAAGTISTAQDALDYLTWTYFFRRLLMNPAYYGLDKPSASSVSLFLSTFIEKLLRSLAVSGCIELREPESLLAEAHRPRMVEPGTATEHAQVVREMHVANPNSSTASDATAPRPLSITALPLGHIAAYYYLSHHTVSLLGGSMTHQTTVSQLIRLLADCEEFSEVPVRHNEDKLNRQLWHDLHKDLSKRGAPADILLPLNPEPDWFSPHVKTRLLLIAHISRHPLPTIDFGTNIVQENANRVLQGMIDVAAESALLRTSLLCIELVQQLQQRLWSAEGDLRLLPHHGDRRIAQACQALSVKFLAEFVSMDRKKVTDALASKRVPGEIVKQVGKQFQLCVLFFSPSRYRLRLVFPESTLGYSHPPHGMRGDICNID